MLKVYRPGRAMPFAQATPDTPEDLYTGFFLACKHLPPELDLPRIFDHGNCLRGTDKGALGTPDAFLIGNGNPPAECARNRDLLMWVEYRERFGEEIFKHLRKDTHARTHQKFATSTIATCTSAALVMYFQPIAFN